MSSLIGKPWTFNDDGIIVDSSGHPIMSGRLSEDEHAKRGNMICAAPDLYEALAFAKSCLLSDEPWDETCEQVIDGALKKARGE